MFEIVRTKKESDIISDFVALGDFFYARGREHASIIIQYKKELFEFHYDASKINLTNLKHDYYHKITETIIPDEVPSFIAWCKNIEKKGSPKYGYFYSGESYSMEDGKHISENGLGEVMTCVGFCLNVLKGFLEDDYLEYNDWESSTVADTNYLAEYCKQNNIEVSSIEQSLRRITPKEFLVSGYFKDLPIAKELIDEKISELGSFFKEIEP